MRPLAPATKTLFFISSALSWLLAWIASSFCGLLS
jgi:hypothetical protein